MLRRIIPVAALLIQLAYAAIASSTPARAIDEIEMGSVGGPTALLWPLYIGTATGMFAAENLDIKQIFAPSSAGVQQQLAAGAFQNLRFRPHRSGAGDFRRCAACTRPH